MNQNYKKFEILRNFGRNFTYVRYHTYSYVQDGFEQCVLKIYLSSAGI